MYFSRPIAVIRPGDVVGSPREVNPRDDQAPFAHEPIGLGTLRDVRYALDHLFFNYLTSPLVNLA